MGTENLPSWWDTPKRQTIEDFKASCYDLSIAIMSCFAVKLGLGNSHFADVHQHKDPGNVLKFIKYPRFEQQPEGVPRLSEHTDWGSITFVFTEQPGLEIRDPSNEWFEIPAVPGGVVVNIGDALSLWSKKSLKSTMHRISWKNLDVSNDRLSVVYFTHPNHDAILSSPTKDSSTEVKSVLTYKEYLKIRSAPTYGSIRKVGEDGEDFEALDEATLKMVKSLNVANSGDLESHRLEVV
ncbi:Oxoglutarate/iron-dependent dioxygenase [Ilyonectria robusta]